MSSYLSPPIGAVVLLCVFVSRTNEPGVFWALVWGFLIGVARMVTSFIFPDDGCDVNFGGFQFNYLYFALVSFFSTVAICLVISYKTAPVEDERLVRLTFWSRFDRSVVYDLKEQNDVDKIVELLNESSKQKILTFVLTLVCLLVCAFLLFWWR